MKIPLIPMNRTRWAGAAVAAFVVAVSMTAWAVTSSSLPDAAPATTTTTALAATTTTSPSAPTTSSPGAATTTTIDDGSLHVGSQGAAVQAVQQRLIDLHYDPGPADGNFGQATMYAVQAFEKLNGFGPDGRVTAAEQTALANPAPATP